MSKTVTDKSHFDQLFKLDRLDLIIQHLRVVFQQHADDQLLQELQQLDGRLVANQKQVLVENTERNQIRARLLYMVKEAIALGYLEPEKPDRPPKTWTFVLLIAAALLLVAFIIWIKIFNSSAPESSASVQPQAPIDPDTTKLQNPSAGNPVAVKPIKIKGKQDPGPGVQPEKKPTLIPVLLILNAVCKDADVLVDGIVVLAEQVSSTRKQVYVQGGMMHTFKVGSAIQSKMVDSALTSDTVEVVLNCH